MKLNQRRKIMVVAGESGGHIFPAVGFCQEIKKNASANADITFIATKTKDEDAWIPSEFSPVFLSINKSFFGLFKLFFNAVLLIWRVHPNVVFGFGGYISVPFVILGKLFGKRTLIHEQNVVPGKANRFLGFFCDRIVVSFEKTKEYFGKKSKIVLARYPLRDGLERVEKNIALDFLGLEKNLFTLLVMGGSQGARRINENFLKALKISKHLGRVQIMHLCGKPDYDATLAVYKTLPARSKVFAFLKEMRYAYSAADLVISRAGAGSIFEIMYFGLPSILIPYPYAGAHQTENAKQLALKGAAIFLEDEKMTPQMISGLLDIFLEDSIRIKAMSLIVSSLYATSENLLIKDAVFV